MLLTMNVERTRDQCRFDFDDMRWSVLREKAEDVENVYLSEFRETADRH